MAAPRGGRQLHRRSDPDSSYSTQQDPIGLAGGLNLYGYANGDPINLRDPFGLSADTIRTDETTAPYVDQCGASSARCKTMIDSLNKLPADWKVVAGAAGVCAPYMVGCVSYNDLNDATAGGTITLVPSEFGAFSFMVNGVSAFGHEIGHVVTRDLKSNGKYVCRGSESCAKGIENVVRAQAGLPPRPK